MIYTSEHLEKCGVTFEERPQTSKIHADTTTSIPVAYVYAYDIVIFVFVLQ